MTTGGQLRRRRFLSLAVTALAGCLPSRGREFLQVLQDDPMASEDLLGLPLQSSYEEDVGTALGKTHNASLNRTFDIQNRDPERVLADAIAAAVGADWQQQPGTGDMDLATGWRGVKSSPERVCSLIVAGEKRLFTDKSG